MNGIIKSISFIFHPILMPLIGLCFYFWKSPKFFPQELIRTKLISILILTVILPILIYHLLKTLGKAKSIYLKTAQERILPLLINAIITILIINRVFPSSLIIELYYFFLGILISTMSCLIFAYLDYKVSIHMIAISGVFTFAIALALHFSINLNGSLSLFAIITGAIGTSRLALEAHTTKELVIGTLIGFAPQFSLLGYWL